MHPRGSAYETDPALCLSAKIKMGPGIEPGSSDNGRELPALNRTHVRPPVPETVGNAHADPKIGAVSPAVSVPRSGVQSVVDLGPVTVSCDN